MPCPKIGCALPVLFTAASSQPFGPQRQASNPRCPGVEEQDGMLPTLCRPYCCSGALQQRKEQAKSDLEWAGVQQ